MTHTALSVAFFLDDVIPDKSLFQSSGSVRFFSGSYTTRASNFSDMKLYLKKFKQLSLRYMSWYYDTILPPNFPSPRHHPSGLLQALHHCLSLQVMVIVWHD